VFEGPVVFAVMLRQAVRLHVAVNHHTRMTVVVPFVDVLECCDRHQTGCQAQDAREHARQLHEGNRMRRRPKPTTGVLGRVMGSRSRSAPLLT